VTHGLASGNTRAEAVCHGLLELFERHQTHAFYRLDFAGQQALRLALHSVDDGLCRGWLDRIAAAGLRCAVWDLSDSLGVPCFLCDLLDARRDAMRSLPRARGVGCHLAKEVALARALSEAAQSRLTAIAGARDDISAPVHAALQQHPAFAEARAQMEDPSQGRTFAEVPSITHATFEEDLRALCQRLPAESANDVVVVALSPPGRPYCVVRVVVPGLRAPHPDVP